MPSKSPSNLPSAVNDFLVLPLQMLALPSFPQPTTHYLYLRANAPKVPTEDTPREIFLVNIPIDTTETHLRTLFAQHLGGARLDRVDFEGARVGKGISAPVAPIKRSRKRKRTLPTDDEDSNEPQTGLLPYPWSRSLHRSGSTAIATCLDAASATLALRRARRLSKLHIPVPWPSTPDDPPLGLLRYQTYHHARFPSSAVLQESVDAYMTAFAAHETQRMKALARLRSVPDADGFITVTRGGGGRADEARERLAELEKREKGRVRDDFYRFQNREKRKSQALELARGFDEDRRRVEEMKRNRKGRVRPEE